MSYSSDSSSSSSSSYFPRSPSSSSSSLKSNGDIDGEITENNDRGHRNHKYIEFKENDTSSHTDNKGWFVHSIEGGTIFSEIPRDVIALTSVVIFNASMMAIMDIILEIMIYHDLFVFHIPFRVEFLILTLISALLGVHALIGLKRRELDATTNSIRLSLVVEIGLVIADVIFLINHKEEWPDYLPVRLPFIVLTTVNIVIIVYVPLRLGITSSVLLFTH